MGTYDVFAASKIKRGKKFPYGLYKMPLSYLVVKMAHFFREIRFRPRDFVKCEIVTMCNGISSGQKKLDSCLHVTLQ